MATHSIKVDYDRFTVKGYVDNDTADYYLDELTDSSGDDLIEQIAYGIGGSRFSRDYDYSDVDIQFENKTDKISSSTGTLSASTNKWVNLEDIGNISFYLDKELSSTSSKPYMEFDFQARVPRSSSSSSYYYYYGVLVIYIDNSVSSTSSGDVSYVAPLGDEVYFDEADFEDFYYDKKGSNATLASVYFSSVSGGTLYSGDSKANSKTCYVNPKNKQLALDEVYFSPSNTKKAGTVKIQFTADGNKGEVSGTVVITYLSGEAKDITYTVGTNGTVALRASDFTAAYKEVTNKTAPSNLTIVFQGVPGYGDLTYTDSSKSKSKDVTLKSGNIRNYNFTTKSSGSNQLEDVVYSGSAGRSDTISYIAYSGGTAQFTGKVVFNGKLPAPTNLSVAFTCYGGAGAAFSSGAFSLADSSVMSNASYLNFGPPSKGTLTYAGASASGGVRISPSMLGMVYYTPNAGFNGTDSVVFAVFDASGETIGSGVVNIVVSGNTTAEPTSPTTPSGAGSVGQFTDVPNNSSTSWYYSQLADLVSKGVIGGKGNGKFDPTGKVTYGEALKMVLRAAGYTAPEASGSDWAINYKNLAVSNGWIGGGIELNAQITRNEVAELVARVLGVPASYAASPYNDDANAYAVALYYTTPQILQGNSKGTFEGGSSLQRAEICVIIYRMNDYVASQYASQRPDGV